MLLTILAFLPFLLIIYLLIIRKIKSHIVMGVVYFTTLLLLLFVWRVEFSTTFFATIKGLLISFEVFLIIISVLILFNLLKKRGKLTIIENTLKEYSNNTYIQIIIIGWFVVSFFEGIAGFGTPAAIAAPLLVFLGFRALTAIVITLVADSVSVVFGAFGTPIIIGILSSIDSTIINTQQLTLIASFLNGFIAIFMPLILLILYNVMEKIPLKNLKDKVFFALCSGIFFAIPYVLVAYFIGPELASVIAAVVGLILSVGLIHFGVGIEKANKITTKLSTILLSFSPYIVLIAFLVITRLNIFNISTLMNTFAITIDFSAISTTYITPFTFSPTTPGVLILITALFFAGLYLLSNSLKKEDVKEVLSTSFNSVKFVFITLLFTLSFVQLLLNSEFNLSNSLGVPQLIGSIFSEVGILYILFAPLIGAFGTFIAGSATVSNLIFTPLQLEASLVNSLSSELILALQTSGAAAGNMIAIHNILAVSALVNVFNQESKIIKINIIIVLIYCFIVSILGYLLYFTGMI